MSNRIQLWPSGRSVEFSGEYPRYSIHEGGVVREATKDENAMIQANSLALMYADRDVLCCDSSLVEELLQQNFSGFTIDDIENQYENTDGMSLEECRDFILDYGSESDFPDPCPWTMDRQELCDFFGDDVDGPNDTETLRNLAIQNIDDDDRELSKWRGVCGEIASENPRLIYEWWRVSNWLCKNLREIGQPVIDNDYGYWWGRCTTGQAMIMDGVLQQVAANALNS